MDIGEGCSSTINDSTREHYDAAMGLARVERDCSRKDYVQFQFPLENLDKIGQTASALSIEHQKASLGINSCYEMQAITGKRGQVLIANSMIGEAI